ncbi:hypothetical protein MKW92_011394 [Papaver armeniacum]|nr:hypothetical protein MKW92_011394 [Papaver armeniacum]
MGVQLCKFLSTYSRFKPHFLMVMTQVGYAFLYFITEASFNHGLNPYVYITYRHIVSGFAVLPFAYFLERKVRPKLTLALFAEFFVLSLLGVSLTLNMYFASLKYTSPTFLASMVNTIASLTLIIAVVLSGKSSWYRSFLGGVMTMTLYRGPAVKNLWSAIIHIGGNSMVQENWLKGSVLVVASCITWSMWYIMQAITLKRYPAPLSLTTWMSFVGAAQSAVFTVIVEHKPKPWAIGFNIDLWAIIYSGVVCSGLIVFIQLWCTEKKGPVFVTMFNPVSTVLVAVLAYFILGERLYMGSYCHFGLYTVLWGKEGDKELQTELHAPSSSSDQEQKETKIQISSMEVVKSEENPKSDANT